MDCHDKGEEEKRKDEHRPNQGETPAPAARFGSHIHGEHRDQDLEDVVVERSQELRPEERLETAGFKQALYFPMAMDVSLACITAKPHHPQRRPFFQVYHSPCAGLVDFRGVLCSMDPDA